MTKIWSFLDFSDGNHFALWTLSIILIILTTFYWVSDWLKMVSYFKKLNLPGPTPLPVFGNFLDVMKKSICYHDLEIIKKYGKTLGYYEGSSPVILTTDLQLIKRFLIKDFNFFVNRKSVQFRTVWPINKFLVSLKDDEWKNARSIVTTSFTSGKLKSMSMSMSHCTKNYDDFLKKLTTEHDDAIFAPKSFFGSYTLDVISGCCFGMETNSIQDPQNIFLQSLQTIFSASLSRSPSFVISFLFPKIGSILSNLKLIEFFPTRPLKFLESVTNQIIDRRKSKLDRRDDFIQSMVEHSEEDKQDQIADYRPQKWNGHMKKTLTNEEIISQSLLFFVAGYDTTAGTLEFISYNLATNQEAQNILLAEIDNVLEKHNGEINYDSMLEMKYMEQVIDETLRMFPPAKRVDREANDDYEYEGIKIIKGQVIAVPIYALHHDPEIYPDPEKFRPERFGEIEKKKREAVSFLPFGAGPRGCIGIRFAFLEMKLLLTTILSKYRFERCELTPEKIILDDSMLSRSKEPIIIRVVRR